MTEWYKDPLPIRRRIHYFICGIKDLSQTWIGVHEAGVGWRYEYHSWFGPMGRFASMWSLIDTAIRGYVYGLRPSTPKEAEPPQSKETTNNV